MLQPIGSYTLIDGVLGLTYVENDGAAFSLLAGKQTFLIIATSLALLLIGYMLIKTKPQQKMQWISLVFIFSGGVGNLIDRIARNYVVDYIELLFMRFAVFNFADCLVTVGFTLLLISFVRDEIKAQSKSKELAAKQEKYFRQHEANGTPPHSDDSE